MLFKGPNRSFSWSFNTTSLRHILYNQFHVLDIYFGATFSKRHLLYNQLHVLDIYFGATFSKRHLLYNHVYNVMYIYFRATFSKRHLLYMSKLALTSPVQRVKKSLFVVKRKW